jgi:anti-sigma factor RsiW
MNDNDRGLQELMNAQLDGVATAEESERLRHVLESRADLRAEYEKLGGVIAALDQLGMEEPPAALKQDVLRAVRVNTATGRERGGWLGTVAALFAGGPGLRQAASFAAGAALGVLLFAALSGHVSVLPGTDTRSMTGTMLPLSGDATYRPIHSHEFTLPRGRVLAETLSDRDGLALRLTSDAPVGTELVATFEPGDWGPTSVGQAATGNEVMLGTGRLSVRIRQPGQSQYLLHLARRGPAGSSLRIAIHSPDGFVQGELETRARRSGS